MAQFIPPSDPSHPDNTQSIQDAVPTSTTDKVILYVFIGLFMGLMTLEVFVDVSPARLTAVFFLFFWVPLTVLHEAGHAIVARALGWHVDGVQLGFGRVQRVFRISGIRIEVRRWPIVGLVRIRPSNLKFARLKNALIYGSGPGIEIGAMGLCIAFVGWDTLTGPTDGYGIALAQAFCLAAATGAVLNLLPFASDPTVVTDGMGIMMSPFLNQAHFEGAMIHPALQEAHALIDKGQTEDALKLLERLTQRYSHVLPVHMGIARCLVDSGQSGEALMRLQAELRSRSDVKPEEAEALLTDLRAYIQHRNNRGAHTP